MNILLFFFAIPVAVIILSAILETLIKSPLKVAGIFFSIFLVIAFALGGTAELIVAAIIYTIISFITAFIVCIIQCSSRWYCNRRICENESRTVNSISSNANLLNDDIEDNEFTVQFRDNTNSNRESSRRCLCRRCR